jgi:hypothetical protein
MATTIVSPSGTTILASTQAWDRFRVTRTVEDRDALVAAFMPLLRAALAMQPPAQGAPALERRTAAAVRAAVSAIETYDGTDAAGLRLHVFRTVTRRLDRFTGR